MTTTTKTNSAGSNALAEANAKIAALEAQLAAANSGGDVKLKVSGKKALSLYGVGRFPLTLYVGQWRTVLANAEKIQKFMEDHKGELAEKG